MFQANKVYKKTAAFPTIINLLVLIAASRSELHINCTYEKIAVLMYVCGYVSMCV